MKKDIFIVTDSNCSENARYKIGRTKNITKRIKGLQVANLNIKLIAEKYIKNYTKEEKRIHHLLKKQNKHIKGEWFKDPFE